MAAIEMNHMTPDDHAAASPETGSSASEVSQEGLGSGAADPPVEEVDLEAQGSPPLRRSRAFRLFLDSINGISDRIPPHWKGWNEVRPTLSLEDIPEGIPRFAAWMNSDDNFFIARRYGWLHTRLIMLRQSELRELEIELQFCDEEDAKSATDALVDHWTFRSDEAGEYRMGLMKKIDDKLKEYDDLVMRAKAKASLGEVSSRNYTSVLNRIYNTAPFTVREKEVYVQQEDFVALVEPKESVSYDGFVEDLLTVLPCRELVRFLFANAEQRATTPDQILYLYDKRRIDLFIRIVMAMLGVALLLVPVVVFLLDQDRSIEKIVVVVVFTLFFSMTLSMASSMTRGQVFAATAAYCAVLVAGASAGT